MTWRTTELGVLCLALIVGCGDDDGSSPDPMDDGGGTTSSSDGSTGAASDDDGSSDSNASAGSSSGPATTDDGPDPDSTGGDSTGPGVECEYPAGAVEPMALGEVLTPYSWPQAIHDDGTQVALELEDAPCGIDDVIEWSPHDVLVFISIPAW